MSGRAATINVIPGNYALSVGVAPMPTPKSWRWVCLTDVARLESGHTPSRLHADYWDGDIPWIGIKDARQNHNAVITTTQQTVTQKGIDNSAARVLPEGTVCLSRTASVGYVTVMGRPMATSQDFVNWVCGPDLDPHFLKHLLVAENESLFRFGKGSTHTTIYYPEVKAFHVCLPPLNEQRRIVAKLEALQSRSRRAREALDAVPPLLEKLRHSILAAAFRGDLTKDWRAQNPNPEPAEALLARIRTERRKKWEASELAKLKAKGRPPTNDSWKAKYREPEPVDTTNLPELPEGWCWASIDTVGDVLLGRRRADAEYVAGLEGRVLRPYVRVANVREDYLDLANVLEMPFSSAELEVYRLQPGDIVLSEGQSAELIGRSATYEGGWKDLCIQATVHRFRAFPSATSSAFAQLVFLHHLHAGVFRAASALTTNIAHLTSERLRPIQFPVPPLAEQELVVQRARGALAAASRLTERCREAVGRETLLQRAVLAKAFRGELVPQDPNDEPADVTLSRVAAVATTEPPRQRARRAKAAE